MEVVPSAPPASSLTNKVNILLTDGMYLKHYMDQDIHECIAAVMQNGLSLQYVMNKTYDICLSAVRQNGLAIQYVPIEMLYNGRKHTDICHYAVKQNGMALEYVPLLIPMVGETYIETYYDIAKKAIINDPHAFQYVLYPVGHYMYGPIYQDTVINLFKLAISLPDSLVGIIKHPYIEGSYACLPTCDKHTCIKCNVYRHAASSIDDMTTLRPMCWCRKIGVSSICGICLRNIMNNHIVKETRHILLSHTDEITRLRQDIEDIKSAMHAL